MLANALPHEEPGIVAILTLSSFLYLLNVINALLDQWIYCGLLGQVFIGVAWGMPGTRWLANTTQEVFTQLGYLGLLLLVYEGGLSTSFSSLKANLFLSIAVAITGICLPIGLSFSLLPLAHVTALQAFAAGAALCSTSLGTTFTVLKTSGLTKSRLGVVLTSAAMMDDVVGLVMVQIISNLKPGGTSVSAITVVRPIFVSLAFATVVPLCCHLILRPVWRHIESNKSLEGLKKLLRRQGIVFVIHTSLLLGLVTGASYAGTSNLFAAYLAGTLISWWDTGWAASTQRRLSPTPAPSTNSQDDAPRSCACLGGRERGEPLQYDTDCQGHSKELLTRDTTSRAPISSRAQSITPRTSSKATQTNPKATDTMLQVTSRSGTAAYEQYYLAVVEKILKPLFFASIGFSIPISQMFRGPVIWRGIVYACLMTIGKLFCGLWLVRLDIKYTFGLHRRDNKRKSKNEQTRADAKSSSGNLRTKQSGQPKPKSLYPASILGSAMVARGEIGFLVSAIAQSNGIFDSTDPGPNSKASSQDLFLIVTWAIMLCTVLGPVTVGLIVRRVRRLQSQRKAPPQSAGQADPLGIWGVDPTLDSSQ